MGETAERELTVIVLSALLMNSKIDILKHLNSCHFSFFYQRPVRVNDNNRVSCIDTVDLSPGLVA